MGNTSGVTELVGDVLRPVNRYGQLEVKMITELSDKNCVNTELANIGLLYYLGNVSVVSELDTIALCSIGCGNL